jgi:hypothetical protein
VTGYDPLACPAQCPAPDFGAWGTQIAYCNDIGTADRDQSGKVDISDVLAVLGAFHLETTVCGFGALPVVITEINYNPCSTQVH